MTAITFASATSRRTASLIAPQHDLTACWAAQHLEHCHSCSCQSLGNQSWPQSEQDQASTVAVKAAQEVAKGPESCGATVETQWSWPRKPSTHQQQLLGGFSSSPEGVVICVGGKGCFYPQIPEGLLGTASLLKPGPHTVLVCCKAPT